MSLRISHEDFVVDWCTSQTLQEVAQQTGMSTAGVKQRAKKLRAAGVNLPALKRDGSVVDTFRVAQLNALINKHKKGQS